MTLRDFLRIVRRWWALILASTLACGAALWFITPPDLAKRPQGYSYTATSTLLVNAANPEAGAVNIGRIAIFVQEGPIPVAAAKKVGYQGNPAQLAGQVVVTADASADALVLSAQGRDGERIAAIVNAFADASVEFFKTSQPGIGKVNLTVLQPATPIAEPIGGGFVVPPSRAIRAALAAALGLLVGCGLAVLFGRLDSRLRTRDQVHAAMALPIVAEVPQLSRTLKEGTSRIGLLSEPRSLYAEGYRTARTAIVHALRNAAPDREGADLILISSAQPSEGKTTSTANIAAAFAEIGKNVLVLDADLRSPDAHVLFDVPQGAGISDYVMDPTSHSLAALARPTSVPGVRIITAGTGLENPAALVSRMSGLLHEVRGMADVVLVDTAPLLAASDVFDILPHVDVVTLVVRAGRLNDGAAARVAELLGRFSVPVAGIVLIGARSASGSYGYGYGGYGYGEKGRRARRKAKAAAAAAPMAARADDGPARAAAVEPGQQAVDDPASAGTSSAT